MINFSTRLPCRATALYETVHGYCRKEDAAEQRNRSSAFSDSLMSAEIFQHRLMSSFQLRSKYLCPAKAHPLHCTTPCSRADLKSFLQFLLTARSIASA